LHVQAVRFVTATAPTVLLWLPGIVVAASAGRDGSLAWWWLVAMGLAVSVGGRFFGNYFLMLTPPLSVLAGIGVARLYRARRQRVWSLAATAMLLAAASSIAAIFWDRIQPSLYALDVQYREAGDWIRRHSSPADSLFVWGDSAQIYVYSRRVMATRFAFTNYQTGTMWGINPWPLRRASTMPEDVVPRAWDELLADLNMSPPRVIADAAAGGLHYFDGQSMDHFPRLWKIVTSRYRYATTAGSVRIYTRVD
jgi:hypothetical protein